MVRPEDWHYVPRATASKYKTTLILVVAAMVILVTLLVCLVVAFGRGSSRETTDKSHGIVIVGSFVSGTQRYHTTFELYQPTSPNILWTSRFSNVSLLHDRRDHVAVVMDNKLVYATGKIGFSRVTDSTEILDLNTFVVTQGPSLSQARAYAGGAVFQTTFVICGGEGSAETLSSCEQLIESRWQTFAPLPAPREGLQMVNVDGKLFCLGGGSDWQAVLTAELHQWEPERRNWVRKAEMMEGRAYFAATAFKHSIIACGSELRYPLTSADTCERYDVSSDRWEYIASMNERRSFMGLVALHESLYVLGGSEYSPSSRNFLSYSSVERYVNGNWSFVTDMKANRGDLVAVAVESSLD